MSKNMTVADRHVNCYFAIPSTTLGETTHADDHSRALGFPA